MNFRTGVALHAAAVMAYLALTLWQTWPLATDPGGWAPHDLGDPLLSTWALWWNATHVPFTHAWWDGAVFYPAPGALALSDHRVGIGLITTPLILAGVSPLAAHNVAFLSSYVLSAVSAYALAFTLTRSGAGAFIAGLVYGFHPFRSEHCLTSSCCPRYWLPVVLLASIDGWRRSGGAGSRWLAASLVLVAFTTGYYFFFLGVLIGLWLAVVRALGPAGAALCRSSGRRWRCRSCPCAGAPGLSIDPSAIRPRPIDHRDRGSQRRHQGLGHAARAARVLEFAGGVANAGGRGLSRCDGDVLLAIALAIASPGVGAPAWRDVRGTGDGQSASALVASRVAMLPRSGRAVEIPLGPFRLSVSEAYKPLSIATLLFLAGH